jgi:hypothetical protein
MAFISLADDQGELTSIERCTVSVEPSVKKNAEICVTFSATVSGLRKGVAEYICVYTDSQKLFRKKPRQVKIEVTPGLYTVNYHIDLSIVSEGDM